MEYFAHIIIAIERTYLATMFTFALLRSPVHPMVVGRRLFAILANADVPERGLTRHFGAVQQRPDAIDVRYYLARGTFHPWSMFL